jgi:hypothetical protein
MKHPQHPTAHRLMIHKDKTGDKQLKYTSTPSRLPVVSSPLQPKPCCLAVFTLVSIQGPLYSRGAASEASN